MTAPGSSMSIRSVPETDVESVPDSALRGLWGIGDVPWLWGTRIRILFVIDGRVSEGSGAEEFGLGPVLNTLRNRWFAWWVRFSVQVVRRDPPSSFRFTQDGFDPDTFDQIWFFGDWPGLDANPPTVTDDIIDRPQYSPMGDDELKILAEWMERGGGVFAAGDHSLLGASMCSRIPRVRTMRKWTRAQGVPSFADEDRHETLVHSAQGALAQEGDRWPQLIYPVLRFDTTVPFNLGGIPHPLLCGEHGVIDHFPDHMHEGSVVEDEDVELDRPLGIPGFDGVEYPTAPLVIGPTHDISAAAHGGLAGLAGGPGPGEVAGPFGIRPRPHMVAHGLTTNRDAQPKRFGLIAAYDGDAAEVGRVVVDSTWHHWFSMNLVGFRDEAPGFYRGMQNYYRNVALWLATPEQRASMLLAATWGVLVGKQPGAFSQSMRIWELGERVVDVIGRTAPQCIVSELVAAVAVRRSGREPGVGAAMADRPILMPGASIVNQAIVGGIASGLLDSAHRHIVERALGRDSRLDEDSIRRGGLDGIGAGKRALGELVAQSAAVLAGLADELSDRSGGGLAGEIPVGPGYGAD